VNSAMLQLRAAKARKKVRSGLIATSHLVGCALCLSRASCKALSAGCGIKVAWRITDWFALIVGTF
jgi:hypothetical protein